MITKREITKNLDETKINDHGASAAQESQKFYEDNICLCEEAYNYYLSVKNQRDEFTKPPTTIKEEQLKKNVSTQVLLVLTSTEIEELVFLHFLSDFIQSKIPTYLTREHGGQIYHIVEINGITLVHAPTKRTGDESMRRTINCASRVFDIDHIVLLGICYGIDHNTQVMCTPVVANDVQGYHINFRDDEVGGVGFEPVSEFSEKPDSDWIGLIETFLRACGVNPQLLKAAQNMSLSPETGQVLSANSLMSSATVKQAVLDGLKGSKQKPSGGEMEICGIFKSYIFEEQNFRKWLAIKSICDWGAGKNQVKKKVKDSLQALAMVNSCEVFRVLINHDFF